MSQQFIDTDLAREILKNYLVSLFEPNAINFSSVNECEVRRASKAISLANGVTAARFNKGPVNRNSFLGACLDATCEEPIEHLIVGYGRKYGNTTKIDLLHHVVGDNGSVFTTQKMSEAIRGQLTNVSKGEVVIFHNHPRWFLNGLLDNLPIASSKDRITAAGLKFNWFQLIKNYLGNGDARFYLGENGYVREFRLPPFDQLVELCRLATQTSSLRFSNPNNSFSVTC